MEASEEDDWVPLETKDSLFKPLMVNFSDKIIDSNLAALRKEQAMEITKDEDLSKNDGLLYNPHLDEDLIDWVNTKKKKDKQMSLVLSCPGCFTQLSYECQRHETYPNQYRAVFVQNCILDENKLLKPKEVKASKGGEFEEEIDFGESEEQKKEREIFFTVRCKKCKAEVGAYDLNEKVYHFFNILPCFG